MLGQCASRPLTCGSTSRAAAPQRCVVTRAFKRGQGPKNAPANRPQQQQLYELPPLTDTPPGAPQQLPPQQLPPQQPQAPAPAQPAQMPQVQPGRQAPNQPQPPSYPGPAMPAYQNPAQPAVQNPAQPGFITPGHGTPNYANQQPGWATAAPAAAPPAAPPAQQPGGNTGQSFAPGPGQGFAPMPGQGQAWQQTPAQGFQPQQQQQQQQQQSPVYQDWSAGGQQGAGYPQQQQQQQPQQMGYMQPPQQGQPGQGYYSNTSGYINSQPGLNQQGYSTPGAQQAGGYMQQGYYQQPPAQQQQQQQQPLPQWNSFDGGYVDTGAYMDTGGYLDQGGYMDQNGQVNPSDAGGYMQTPPRTGWQQQNSGYYTRNTRQPQQQQQQYNVDQAGGYVDTWYPKRGQKNFQGFQDTGDLTWSEDVLLKALDANQAYNNGYGSAYPLQEWVEEVVEEEDLTPKYVNGKRVLCNSEIEADTLRVQDALKNEIGIMSYDDAREKAIKEQADVVLINDNAEPPVVRLIAFSKYKYEMEKSAKQKQKASKGPEMKEVKLRPVTEKADYDTKVRQAQKFLDKGSKVKLTMTFSGREMRFKDQGKEMMLKLIEELSTISKMEAPLSLRPSNFSVTLVPLK